MLDNSNQYLCSINESGQLNCVLSDLGAYTIPMPLGFESGTVNVVTDVHKLFLDTNPSDTLYNRVFGATYKG